MSADENIDELPLPYGWVKQIDPKTTLPFWVDTKAKPSRSIWTHPYRDETYLSEHPEVREKISRRSFSGNDDAKVMPQGNTRRHSFHAEPPVPETSRSPPNVRKRGFFGKLKDKAIGTKEERREQAEKRKREAALRYQEQMLLRQQRIQQLQQQQPNLFQYNAPYGVPQRQYNGGGYPGAYYNSGGRSGGSALPLIGGLAGGFLLGDLIGGGLDGGGFGGGDFGGGDFGGGGF